MHFSLLSRTILHSSLRLKSCPTHFDLMAVRRLRTTRVVFFPRTNFNDCRIGLSHGQKRCESLLLLNEYLHAARSCKCIG